MPNYPSDEMGKVGLILMNENDMIFEKEKDSVTEMYKVTSTIISKISEIWFGSIGIIRDKSYALVGMCDTFGIDTFLQSIE